MWVVLIASMLSGISPLLMANINSKWPYWDMAFIAQVSKLNKFNMLFSPKQSKQLPSDLQLSATILSHLLISFIQVLQPLCPDVLFTVGLLVISAVFPTNTQALGGAIFNTCSQLGTSIGLTITAVVFESRTAGSRYADKGSPDALMVGYRAVFWTLFSWMMLVCFAGAAGLRRMGKIGAKQD